MSWRNAKYVRVTHMGIRGIWKPQSGKELIIDSIDLFGYCKGSSSKPFIVHLEIFQDNSWVTIGGLNSITERDFELHYVFQNGLHTNKGDGVHPRLRVRVSGDKNQSFCINVSVIGIEY